MWQKQLKTTLQDVLGQLLKYGVASSGLTPRLRCYCALARDLSLVFAFAHWCTTSQRFVPFLNHVHKIINYPIKYYRYIAFRCYCCLCGGLIKFILSIDSSSWECIIETIEDVFSQRQRYSFKLFVLLINLLFAKDKVINLHERHSRLRSSLKVCSDSHCTSNQLQK